VSPLRRSLFQELGRYSEGASPRIASEYGVTPRHPLPALMDPHVRDAYLFEAVKQCRFGLNAHIALQQVLERLATGRQSLDFDTRNTLHNEVFRSLHSLLAHAGVVSRLLWTTPPKQHKNESVRAYDTRVARHRPSTRATLLRRAAGLPDEHALKSREIRDHLEHFDERLDRWAATSVSKNLVQDLIGGPNTMKGIADEDMMRWYDPTTHSLRFQGVQFEIAAIVVGLDDVSDACTRVLARSGFMSSLKLVE
jgi:hypothetical protein